MSLINTQKIIKGAKIIRPLLKRYRLRISGMIMLGFLAGLFGGLGISVLIPLFAILTNQEELSLNFISGLIENMLGFFHIPLNAFFLITLIIILFILKALVQFLSRYVSEATAAKYEKDAREELFDKTINASWPHLLKYKSGYLERVLMNDVAAGGAIISSIGNISLFWASFLVYAIIAFGISPIITLSTILFGITIFFVLKPIFYRIRKLTKKMVDDQKNVSHQISESITGAKTIKSYAAEQNITTKSEQYFEQLRLTRTKVSFIRSLLGQFGEPAGIVFVGIMFLLIRHDSSFNIASFAVAVYLIQKMFNLIQNAQNQLNGLNELIPYMNVARKYYEDASENKESSMGNKEFGFNEKLEFNDIYFSYDDNRKILSGVSFVIEKNASIGLIGPSGVGKTTMVDLIMRLFRPQKGQITIDGVGAEEFSLSEWRKNIAYVPQDVFLINDTIENNIKFYDNSISKEAIIKATKAANIYKTINGLEDGFKTLVGERGVRLSVGQRQRIVLARALVRKPSILILDEATSSLDNESERAIQESINKMRGKTTIITIAHRLNTIMDSDKLIVLDNGKIIEEGNPKELLKNKDSHFYKMYTIST